MHLPSTLFWLFAFFTTIHALALPSPLAHFASSATDLFKRKGGGGGGGRGGGGGGGSRGGSPGRGSSSSSRGGSTSTGSGTPRSFGGFYGGGSAQPYKTGTPSPRGILPYAVGGAGLGLLGGALLVSAFAYPWPGTYHWHNNTANEDEMGTVNCLCNDDKPCSCEANNSTDFLNMVANNDTISRRLSNGTLVINGSLADGTVAPTDTGAATSLRDGIMQSGGLWVVVAGVVYTVLYV